MTTPIPDSELTWRVTGGGSEWLISGHTVYGVGDLPPPDGHTRVERVSTDRPFGVTTFKKLQRWVTPGSDTDVISPQAVTEPRRIRDQLRGCMNPRAARHKTQPVHVAFVGGKVRVGNSFAATAEAVFRVDGSKLWRLLHGWTPATLLDVCVIGPRNLTLQEAIPTLRIIGDGRYGLLVCMTGAGVKP